jgi:hypothetical protein
MGDSGEIWGTGVVGQVEDATGSEEVDGVGAVGAGVSGEVDATSRCHLTQKWYFSADMDGEGPGGVSVAWRVLGCVIAMLER